MLLVFDLLLLPPALNFPLHPPFLTLGFRIIRNLQPLNGLVILIKNLTEVENITNHTPEWFNLPKILYFHYWVKDIQVDLQP